jgi:peroxiredoxin Q/BCP
MRLQEGQLAPAFSMRDTHDQTVALEHYRGRHLLLSFYRYASCPFCNLRVHELIQRAPEFDRHRVSLVAVFQSSRAGIMDYVGKQRPLFPILPDPEHRVYRRYGVESSLHGFLAGAMLHMGKAMKSMGMGFLPGPMDGSVTLVPADFLIAPDGRIRTAYYGRDISDHLPIEAIWRALHAPAAA